MNILCGLVCVEQNLLLYSTVYRPANLGLTDPYPVDSGGISCEVKKIPDIFVWAPEEELKGFHCERGTLCFLSLGD